MLPMIYTDDHNLCSKISFILFRIRENLSHSFGEHVNARNVVVGSVFVYIFFVYFDYSPYLL